MHIRTDTPTTNTPDASPGVPLSLLASGAPPGVPRALWRAYGDRYPGGPRRTREQDEAAARYMAEQEARRAAEAREAARPERPRTVVIDLSGVDLP